MNKSNYRFRLSSLAVAVLASFTNIAQAAEETEEATIEEVVVKASRLKGTASAVIEERKNQAFVADILGAEQIGRTGDSDAASALRRVTGLTLVDGKFIYIRGLGERYSSTQLNGANVPSPDPTRTVIPLDLFPSDIIESLSVQKAYSPSLPGHFGGGNVDVRLKSMPTDFLFNLSANIGGNTNNFGEGFTYEGGSSDWRGEDDGTRGAPSSLNEIWSNYESINDLDQDANREIFLQMHRDYDLEQENLAPDLGLGLTVGNRYDSGDFEYGFLTSLSYDNEWQYSDQFEGQDFVGKSDGSYSLVRGFDQVKSTEHSVRLAGMFNFGLIYDRNHRFDFTSTILRETEDQIKDKLGNTNNVLLSDGLRIRDITVEYQERELIANQLRGTHNFPDFWSIGVDWKYSDSRSNRYAPGNFESRFILADANQDGIFDLTTESSLRKGSTAARYNFQNLNDDVENYGYNVSLPLTFKHMEVELKVGADFIETSREAFGRRLDINTLGFDNNDLSGGSFHTILGDDVIRNYAFQSSDNIVRDTSVDGDEYISAQMNDAYYIEGDLFINNVWRVSGGLRWEDFRRVTVGLKPDSGQFDIPDEPTTDDLVELAFKEDDVFKALAFTYIPNESTQYRLSYGETAIRPDLRESAKATYIDPLTEFPVGGTPGIKSTEIKHYDLRWEWYMESGENLSVGLFYKDMINPIEDVQSPSQDGPPLIRIANAEDGEVYGIEFDFLKDVGDDFFLSGNLTLSDSEVNIDPQSVVEQTGVSTSITNKTRRLSGHSEYVVNLNLGYDAPNGNHSATLAYNVFGERIIIAGIEGRDDAYEQPFHSLDLIYTYYPTYSSTVKFKINNILDEKKELEFENTLIRSKESGIGFDIAFKWNY